MNCPFCGKEMMTGFIQSTHGVIFATEPHYVSLWPVKTRGEFFVTSKKWFGPICTAYHCDSCKNVIITYAQKTE